MRDGGFTVPGRALQPAVLLALIAAVLWAYWPGLKGPFLFDDYSNLALLKIIGGEVSFENLREYFMAGNSGPTGRPVSMASFLLNDFSWPSSAESFKYTNLLLHLLNGVLLCWVTFLFLMRSQAKSDERSAFYVAAFFAAFWLLNPYQMSSVMYAVQRMALLSTFFVISGFILYFKGRCLLEQGRVVSAYFLIFTAYFWAVVIGVFAKENAVIFVLLIPLVEYFFFSNKRGIKSWFLSLVIFLPVAAFFIMLLLQWPSHRVEYELIRDFTLGERLLSQGRAVGYYLLRYAIPGVSYIGVLADGFEKSTGLLSPLSTLLFLIMHAGLVALALVLRRKLPLFSFGVLFFYVAHILESSHIPLELLFEHRNYLPSAFLFLGFAHFRWGRVWFLAASVMILVCLFLARVQAGFWSNEHDLKAIMMVENPSSERAALVFAEYVQRSMGNRHAISVLEQYGKSYDLGIEGSLNLVKLKCLVGEDDQSTFDLMKDSVKTYRGKSVFLASRIRELSTLVVAKRCNYLDLAMLQEFVDAYHDYWPGNALLEQTHLMSSAHLTLIGGDYFGFKDLMYQVLDVTPNPELDLDFCNWLDFAGQAQDACHCFTIRKPEPGSVIDLSRNRLRRFYGYSEKIHDGFARGIERTCSN